MPENFLSKYLVASFDKKYVPPTKQGLVVTISRQKGCGALPIAEMIIEELNQLKYPHGKVVKWKLLSKEILEQSAQKLKVAPAEVDAIMESQEKNVFDEMLLLFSEKSLPNDIKIKNTIRGVIENAANEGNMIIIGQGGVCITRNRKNSLHIKLVAPTEWRIENVAVQDDISLRKAEQIISERDQQREALRQYYLGNKKVNGHIYDMVINVSTMKQSEIASAIFQVIKERQNKLLS